MEIKPEEMQPEGIQPEETRPEEAQPHEIDLEGAFPKLADGRTVEIEETISDHGATAIVYQGLLAGMEGGDREPVAVKVFRPAIDVERAKNESDTLRELTTEAGRLRQKHTDNCIQLTPRWLGEGEHTERGWTLHFIVMEYVRAGEILEQAKLGQLSQLAALSAMRQFMYFLEFIHGTSRCVRDFKVANLRWSDGSLRILDVGDIVPFSEGETLYGKAEYDVLKAGIVLFQLLTGHGLTYGPNGLEEAIEPLLEKHPLEWGIRHLLLHWLGRGDQGSRSAADLGKELDLLLQRRDEVSPRLLADALNLMRNGVNALGEVQDRSLIEQARRLLGFLETRLATGKEENMREGVTRAVAEADTKLRGTSRLSMGVAFLSKALFGAALEQFERDSKDGRTDDALRWYGYVARMGKSLGLKDDEQWLEHWKKLQDAIDCLGAGDHAGADRALQGLGNRFGQDENFAWLANEAKLMGELAKADEFARQEKYGRAADKYGDAIYIARQLPAANGLNARIGAWEKEQLRLNRQDETIGAAREKARAALKALQGEPAQGNAFQKAFKLFQEARDLTPEDEKVFETLNEAVQHCIEQARLQEALRLAGIEVSVPQAEAAYWNRYAGLGMLCDAQWELQQNQLQRFVPHLEAAYQLSKEHAPVLQPALLALLDKAAGAPATVGTPQSLRGLAVLARGMGDEPRAQRLDAAAQQAEQRLKAEWQPRISERVQSAMVAVRAGPAEGTDELAQAKRAVYYSGRVKNLEQAQANLLDARSMCGLIGEPDTETTEALALVDRSLKEAQEDAKKLGEQKNAWRQRMEAMRTSWVKTNDWYMERGGGTVPVPGPLSEAFAAETTQLLAALQDYLERVDSEDAQVRGWLEEASGLRVPASVWRWIRDSAETYLSAEKTLLQQFEEALRAGSVERAEKIVRSAEREDRALPQLTEIKEKLASARMLADWMKEPGVSNASTFNQALFDQLIECEKRGIVGSLWEKGATNYLDRLARALQESLRKRRAAEFEGAQSLGTVKDWMRVSALLRRAQQRVKEG